MGDLEKKVQTRVNRSRINSAIIAALASTGMLVMASIAPNMLKLLGGGKRATSRQQAISRALVRLINSGYVKREGKGQESYLRLTEKGEHFAALMGEGRLAVTKPKRWDGKWRVLIFDLPEGRKKIRDKIRRTLLTTGFHRLQDSVWVFPYPCEDFVALLKMDLRVGKELIYMIVEEMEGDRTLRTNFSLPLS